MDMNAAFPSKYLASLQDIGKLGTEKVVTVARVTMAEDIGEDQETKPLVYFNEFDKGMVWNKTNNKIMVAMHGTDSDDWIGKQIVLYSTETEFGGEIKPCIRVRSGGN